MNRGGAIALVTIGPLAVGVCAFLLLVAAFLKLFTKDEQGLASLAFDAALTVAAGALLVVAIAHFAL